ncbi:MAG: NAD-dependent epimerase/dehydratase family protein [Burkholderiales bacterium]|nr:NAD-dependent epimerase/dehydratase family protein [Burkholderiales bacterium]
MSPEITLVTGATGFIGGRVLQPNDRPLVRTARGLRNEVVGDLRNADAMVRACRGVKQVLHCAGHAHAFSSPDDSLHHSINFEGTRNLLAAAGRTGVERFIFLSSVKAMAKSCDECVDEDWPGEPMSAYGRAKRDAEAQVLEAGSNFGMHVVNLRLAMVYGRGEHGNLSRMARGIQAGWFPNLPETHNRRSLVHVNDVVAAVNLVAERSEANGKTYIVADPKTYSGREICDAIRSEIATSKTRIFKWSISERLLRTAGKCCDFIENLSGRCLPINSQVVDRLLCSDCYSPMRIERELGWRARTSLSAGLREMLAHEETI